MTKEGFVKQAVLKTAVLTRIAGKYLTAPVLLVFATVLFCSFGGEEVEYGGTVTIPLVIDLEGFHPLVDRNVGSEALQLVYSSLVKIDESLVAVPDLAESWAVSEDGLIWDFNLRKGVQFHDGHILDSHDVVFTLQEILRGGENYAVSPLFANIKAVSEGGPLTVHIELYQPYAPLLDLLTVEIMPSHLLEEGQLSVEEFRKAPIGTGPFTFSEWTDDTFVFSVFEDYFEGRAYLDSVVLRRVQDSTQAWSELMQGRVSVVRDLGPDDFEVIENDDRFTTYSYLDFFYYTVLLNNADPLLSDPRVRRAIDMAVNKAEIVTDVLDGRADETTGPFIPGTWPYNNEVKGSGYDPESAIELLESAGWSDSDGDSILDKDGGELSISLLIDEGDALKDAVAKKLKWQLYQIGVRIDVEYLPLRDLLQTRIYPGQYQTALLQFNAAGDPDSFTYLFWHSSRIGALNIARYGNAEVDLLLVQGRSENDSEKRESIYREIHRLMADDTASIFLFTRRIYVGATSRIEGFKAQPQLLLKSVREWKIKAQ